MTRLFLSAAGKPSGLVWKAKKGKKERLFIPLSLKGLQE